MLHLEVCCHLAQCYSSIASSTGGRRLGSSCLLSQQHRTALCRYTAHHALCGTVSLDFTSEQERCGLSWWYFLLRWKHQAQSSGLCQWSALIFEAEIQSKWWFNISVVSFKGFLVFWGNRVRSAEHFVWSMWGAAARCAIYSVKESKRVSYLVISASVPSLIL